VKKTRRTVCVAVCALAAAGIATAQTKAKKLVAEPTAFYEDCGEVVECLQDPITLPANVLDALWATDEAKSMRGELRSLGRDGFSRLFKAVVIHLGSSKETDYVVLSEFPMGGVDAPWFWIVRMDQIQPKIIFFSFANGFELLKAKTNGYPNIRSLAFAGDVQYTNVYHYDGQRYVLVRKYQKEMK